MDAVAYLGADVMRWEDERYVRLYTRDTIEWEMLCWQARALMPQILRKVDRAGLLELGVHGARGLARSVKLPLEIVVQPGLDGTADGTGLITSGSIEMRGSALVVPNFIAAQETPSSDAQRKRDQRERAVAHARLEKLDAIQSGHEPSRVVTEGHSVPSDPFLAEPSQAVPDLPGKPTAPVKRVVDRWRILAEEILGNLNAARKRVRSSSRGISASYDSLALIAERLEGGASAEDCLHVVEVCEAECRANADAFRWFDAVTPFRRENFVRKCAADPALASAASTPTKRGGNVPPSDFSGHQHGIDAAHLLKGGT